MAQLYMILYTQIQDINKPFDVLQQQQLFYQGLLDICLNIYGCLLFYLYADEDIQGIIDTTAAAITAKRYYNVINVNEKFISYQQTGVTPSDM